jgi:hypothetical protein
MLARASSNFTVLNWSSSGDYDKWQTKPLVRGGARYRQTSNCQTVINIWSWAPDGARNQDALTDWSSVVMWLWLWLLVSFWRGFVQYQYWRVLGEYFNISYWRVWRSIELLKYLFSISTEEKPVLGWRVTMAKEPSESSVMDGNWGQSSISQLNLEFRVQKRLSCKLSLRLRVEQV